jgi:pyruvate/2-oxoglutarate dehydrogenase complex dihydrolipoamide dehydrogenase (E3) component
VTTHFNVLVLGAGPGGYVAAIRAAQLGQTVAVVEEKYWGGVCLNVGCIPSKALLRNAEIAHIITKEKDVFGISGDATMDYGTTHKRSRGVAEASAKGVHYLMKKNKITEIDGWGTLKSPTELEVDKDGTKTSYTFDNLIIGTGAKTRLIPGTTLSDRVVTYEEQILTDQLPGSIIIAGSGAIGVEFAYVMVNFGVDVTIVEFLDRMVPTEDPDVSKELLKQYKKLGVKVLLSTKVESIDDSGDKVKVVVSKDGNQETLEADKVLQAIGFAPRVEGYGLDAAGVRLTDRGAIEIDSRGRTNVDNIYAIGDVTGKLMLYRGAGQGEGVRRQGLDVPVLRQRQGPRHGRGGRLREDRGRRRVQRDRRRPHDRPRGHRAAAGAHAGPAVGPHRRRGRPQRLRPPDARRGHEGSRRGHRRPHDQPLRPAGTEPARWLRRTKRSSAAAAEERSRDAVYRDPVRREE